MTTFQKLCFCLYIQSFFLKLVHEFELLKQTFWLDVRRNILLYYLQVGGYSAEHFFEARSNFNEIMLLELFNQGIGLQVVCINTSNFCHGATFFCICQLPWILDTRPWLNIYILNSNKSKKNVIAYLYVALFLFNMGKYILIPKKRLVLMYSCLQLNK